VKAHNSKISMLSAKFFPSPGGVDPVMDWPVSITLRKFMICPTVESACPNSEAEARPRKARARRAMPWPGSLVGNGVVIHHLNCGAWDWFLRWNAKRPRTLAETRRGHHGLPGLSSREQRVDA